jgi:hypothetical protein
MLTRSVLAERNYGELPMPAVERTKPRETRIAGLRSAWRTMIMHDRNSAFKLQEVHSCRLP